MNSRRRSSLLLVGATSASLAMTTLWLQQVRSGDASLVDVGWAVFIACAAVLYSVLADGDVTHRVVAAALASIWGWRLGLLRPLTPVRCTHQLPSRTTATRPPPPVFLRVRSFLLHVPSRRMLAALTAAAVVLVPASISVDWAVWPEENARNSDVHVYYRYGNWLANGWYPYRDFAVEYPPAALPVFVFPTTGLGFGNTDGAVWYKSQAANEPAENFQRAFTTTMGIAMALIVVVTALSLHRLGARFGHALVALATVGLTPILLGALVVTRFDAWPTLLLAIGLLLLIGHRSTASAAVLAAAVAVKVYPIVLMPLLLADAWRRRGPAAAGRAAATAALVFAGIFSPFLVTGTGVVASLRLQLERGLQIESLPASLVGLVIKTVDKLHFEGVAVSRLPYETCNDCSGIATTELQGSLASVAGGISSVATVAIIVALWVAFARGDPSDDQIVRYSAASVTAIVAFGKVLSPQFLLWLVPLVVLVRGTRGAAAWTLLTATLILTNVLHPGFGNLLHVDDLTLLLSRNALLVALFAVLAWPSRVSAAPCSLPGRTTSRTA